VVVIARHGDRTSFYQNPVSYAASDTVLTPLGEQQNFRLGQILNSIYAANESDRKIEGLSATEMVGSQINSTADAGGEGSVIWDSAVSLWQGFYPPRLDISNMTLANGSTITSPLGGYQYVKVETLLPEYDVDFESWTNCEIWTERNAKVYKTNEWLAKAQAEEPFFATLRSSGIVGNRTVSLDNIYNVFDFVNVNSIHNSTFNDAVNALGNGTLPHLRDLASYHEAALFTAPNLDGLGNIAALTLLPRIFGSLREMTKSDNEVLVTHYHLAYKPFLSLFNMTNLAAAQNPSFPNYDKMVDYASMAVYEIRDGGSGPSGYDVRFGFRNGSETSTDVTYYPLFGTDSLDIDLETFASNVNESALLPSNEAWCHYCNNNGSVPVCYDIALADQYEDLAAKYKEISDGHFTSVGSGFIGACVTIVVMLAALGLFRALGWIQFGKRKTTPTDRYPLNEQHSFKGSINSSRA
ncbi:hypothetical protein JCM10207_002706, partial [Rhodosporidiobolus poonsookiae]